MMGGYGLFQEIPSFLEQEQEQEQEHGVYP